MSRHRSRRNWSRVNFYPKLMWHGSVPFGTAAPEADDIERDRMEAADRVIQAEDAGDAVRAAPAMGELRALR